MGEENGGWTLITNQLNFERVAICPVSGILRSIAEVREWARATRLADGRRVIDQEWVQLHLARLWARAEYLKLINWKVAWAADKGLNPADASATKVYGSEFALEAYRVLLEIVGQAGYLAEGSPGAVLGGHLEQRARSQTIFTFGGGTNEIQRDIIAWVGLGLPRSPALTARGPHPSRTSARPTLPRTQVPIADAHGEGIADGDSSGQRGDHRVRRHRRAGPAVVLAHGFLMDRSMFADQVAALRDRLPGDHLGRAGLRRHRLRRAALHLLGLRPRLPRPHGPSRHRPGRGGRHVPGRVPGPPGRPPGPRAASGA